MITVVDKDKVPVELEYTTERAAGFDIRSTEHVILHPGERKLIPTGLHLLVEDNETLFELQIRIRSGVAYNSSLLVVNSPGCVDEDFVYPSEIKVIMGNFGNEIAEIKKGERVAQGVFNVVFRPDNPVVNASTRQGGFGSTGRD